MTPLDAAIWLAFAVAQIADVLTTNAALRKPGLKEGHPLWRWVQRRFGRAWWVVRIGAGAAVGVGLWWAFSSTLPIAVVALAIAAVAANNWRLARL